MTRSFHVFMLTLACIASTLSAHPAWAEKTVVISEEAIDRIRGNDVLYGKVTRVGHEILFIETDDGQKKIDVDDINFPAPLDEIFDEETTVIATGKLKRDRMTAHRIVVVKDGSRQVFISKKPVDIRIKGEEDIKIRITP